MKLLFIAALMVVWVSPLRSTPTKTVLRVKREAMDYAFQTSKRPLQEAFGNIPIPSVMNGGNKGILGMGLGLMDSIVKLEGGQILEVKLPEVSMQIMPNEGMKVSIGTGFKIKGNVAFVGDININAGASIDSELRVTRSEEGLPNLSVSSCKSKLPDIKVTGGFFGILPALSNVIKGHIEVALGDTLCAAVSNVFLGFNANLGGLVGKSAIGGSRSLEYTMPGAPVMRSDYMDVPMDAEYEVDKRDVHIPNGASDFTLPPGAGKKNAMVNLGLSQDFFTAMFIAFQSSGGFNVDIPSTAGPDRDYMSTSKLGKIIPEIRLIFKDSLPLNMKIIVSQTPIVTLDSDFLLVEISPVIEMYVATNSLRSQHLISLDMGASLIAKLDVSGGKIQASVGLQGDLTITSGTSSFGNYKTSPSALAGYIREIFVKAYLVQLNADLSVGVTLPSIPDVDLIHGVVEIKKECVIVSGDVQYTK